MSDEAQAMFGESKRIGEIGAGKVYSLKWAALADGKSDPQKQQIDGRGGFELRGVSITPKNAAAVGITPVGTPLPVSPDLSVAAADKLPTADKVSFLIQTEGGKLFEAHVPITHLCAVNAPPISLPFWVRFPAGREITVDVLNESGIALDIVATLHGVSMDPKLDRG